MNNGFAAWFDNWRKQPSTLIAAGLMLGAVVYGLTKSTELTLVAIGVVPGAMNDHTRDLMGKIESIEDGVRSVNETSAANASHLLALRRTIADPRGAAVPAEANGRLGQQTKGDTELTPQTKSGAR